MGVGWPANDGQGRHRQGNDDETPVIESSRGGMAARALGTEHRDRTGKDADQAGRDMHGHDSQEGLGRRRNYDPEDHDALVTHENGPVAASRRDWSPPP